MGYIPAFLVLISGGFLWGMVVYNSLKLRREALLNKLNKIAELAAERNRVIQAILNESSPTEIGNFVDDPFTKVQSIKYSIDNNFLDEESKARIWIKGLISQLRENDAKGETLNTLISLATNVDDHLKDFVRKGKSYNSLITKKPTSYMASTLNFKPVAI